jgi:hypothetical protein
MPPPPAAAPRQEEAREATAVTAEARVQTQAGERPSGVAQAEAVADRASPAAASAARGAGRGGAAGRGGRQGLAPVAAATPFEVTASDGRARWRVTATRVEYAASESAAFQPTAMPTTDGVLPRIAAGAAPGGDVCWLVGANGLILRTTDGVRFEHITAPATVDLTAVRATDARRAGVTTATGLTYVTADAGASWRLE